MLASVPRHVYPLLAPPQQLDKSHRSNARRQQQQDQQEQKQIEKKTQEQEKQQLQLAAHFKLTLFSIAFGHLVAPRNEPKLDELGINPFDKLYFYFPALPAAVVVVARVKRIWLKNSLQANCS